MNDLRTINRWNGPLSQRVHPSVEQTQKLVREFAYERYLRYMDGKANSESTLKDTGK